MGTQHKDILDEVVVRLLEKETIDGFELADIVQEKTGKPAPAYASIPQSVQESFVPSGRWRVANSRRVQRGRLRLSY